MYIVKNAIINITRNKGRNILIGIIIMVIAAACSITLAIRASADKIVTSYEKKYPVNANIGMDREALTNSLREGDKTQEEMINTFNSIKAVTKDEIKKYGDSKYVSSYYYTSNINMNAKDIKEATDSLVKETTTTKVETTTKNESWTKRDPSNRPGGPLEGGSSTTQKKTTTSIVENIRNEKAGRGTFSLVGYNSYESMVDFVNGNYTIKEGEVSNDFKSNSCVISEELATLNKLSVGDKITFKSPNDEKITYELTITGIYKENTDESSNMSNMYSNSANRVITNVTVIDNIVKLDTKLEPTITPTFILKSTDVVDKFTKEVKQKGLSEYYTVTSNVDTVLGATKSIVSVKKFATTFLLITLVIGATVLFVINMINIRERKYEIGVLRTIGMKKTSVISEFMLELLIVCIIFLLAGAGVGALSSVQISNSLLEQEIENAETDYNEINNNFGGSMEKRGQQREPSQFGITNIEKVDSMDAVVDYQVLGKLLGIGVLLTVVSSISSMIAISRFSPLDILKERS